MSQANIELIKRVYAAFNQASIPAVLQEFAPTIQWHAADHSPLADRSPYRGLEAVRDGVFLRITQNFDRLVVRVDEIFSAAADRVVALGYYDGALKSNRTSFQAQVAHIWTIADGKVVKFQQYVDTYQLAEAANAA